MNSPSRLQIYRSAGHRGHCVTSKSCARKTKEIFNRNKTVNCYYGHKCNATDFRYRYYIMHTLLSVRTYSHMIEARGIQSLACWKGNQGSLHTQVTYKLRSGICTTLQSFKGAQSDGGLRIKERMSTDSCVSYICVPQLAWLDLQTCTYQIWA